MLPWKMFAKSVAVVTLLTVGGFAAGSNVVPFSNASRSTAPLVVLDESVPGDDAPAVDPAVEVDESTTTNATDPAATDPAADTNATDPAADSPSGDPVPVAPPVIDVTPPTPPTLTPTEPDAAAKPPALPAENDAPAVCAAAAQTVCGPTEPTPPAAATFEARVQRCQDWWNRLADLLAERRPAWGERARKVAERCEAIVTRWQERRDRAAERRAEPKPEPAAEAKAQPKAEKPKPEKKAKGDHNCDGRPDNGWHKKSPMPPCPEKKGKGRR